jgi:hypothetical protein
MPFQRLSRRGIKVIKPQILLAVAMLLALPASLRAEENDLREFRLGMKVADLPAVGYTGFTCADKPAQQLAAWSDYGSCPADSSGYRGIAFRYDDSVNPRLRLGSNYGGTKVAGQPVLLSLLIGPDTRVMAIRIQTDPSVRLFMHKKQFLFADQIKAHYGVDGWTCHEAKPKDGEEPVGGVFIHEHCEKSDGGKNLSLDQELYRQGGHPAGDFVSATNFTISLSS